MALPTIPFRWVGTVWDLAHKVHGLLEAQNKASKAIEAVDNDVQRIEASLRAEIQRLELEIERLKAREEVLIARAEAAAAVAAGAVAARSVADTARRIGSLEERVPPSRNLPSPED